VLEALTTICPNLFLKLHKPAATFCVLSNSPLCACVYVFSMVK